MSFVLTGAKRRLTLSTWVALILSLGEDKKGTPRKCYVIGYGLEARDWHPLCKGTTLVTYT